MGLISIVIATYNRSKLLRESLESLLAQTYRDIEIIVVDDGSTDDTQATITEIARKHNNVRYYSRPHRGAPAARNFGLANTTGEFICFFDSDDLWPPEYIEIMVKNLQANPGFGAAYSRIMRYNDGKINGQYGSIANPPCGFVTADLFTGKPFILPSSTIFRKDVWADTFWDETLKNRQDLDVFLRISTRTKFMYVPEIYALHRKHNNSISVMAGKDVLDDGPRVMERFYFQLGGNTYVQKKWAFLRISHRYRHFARRNLQANNRTVAMVLLKRALYYYPLDLRLYVDLFRAFFSNPKNDKMPDWQEPPKLTDLLNEDGYMRRKPNERGGPVLTYGQEYH